MSIGDGTVLANIVAKTVPRYFENYYEKLFVIRVKGIECYRRSYTTKEVCNKKYPYA